MTPEGRIKRSILEYLDSKGIVCWNNQTTGIRGRTNHGKYSPNGAPDILGVMGCGTLLAIEVKTKTGKVSERQEAFLEKLKRSGAKAGVCRSVQDAEDLLCSPRYVKKF